TARLARAGAGSDAAPRLDRRIVLVDRSVTVVVDAVAGRVVGCWRSRLATVDHGARNAGSRSGRRASSHPTTRALRDIVLVDHAVAIVVDPVARRIVRGGLSGLTIVHHTARSAPGRAAGGARAYS